jgi:hypothetical protein
MNNTGNIYEFLCYIQLLVICALAAIIGHYSGKDEVNK